MASIRRRELPDGQVRWDVRYRLPGEHREHSRSFAKEREAKAYRSKLETDIRKGIVVDPRRQDVTVADWCDEWLAGKVNLSPKTRDRYEGVLRAHIRPRWGRVKLSQLRHADVQKWLSGLGLAAASVRKIHGVLSQALDYAVKDGRLGVNPAAGVSLPRMRQSEKVFLNHEQVRALAEACGPEYELVVLFLAYTGLRWGEMAALRVKNLDFTRQRVIVAESVTPVGGRLVFGPPKGHARREVPIPRFLTAPLMNRTAGKGPGEFVFLGLRGGVMRTRTFQRVALAKAVAALGLGYFTPHMLRHTAASLAIASGADVKVVQTMLGHKSATMTLDLYGHLFGDRLDVVAESMEAARVAALGGA